MSGGGDGMRERGATLATVVVGAIVLAAMASCGIDRGATTANRPDADPTGPDVVPPALAVTLPPDETPYVTNHSRVFVIGRVESPERMRVEIDGEAVVVEDGVFEHPVAIGEGETKKIEIVAIAGDARSEPVKRTLERRRRNALAAFATEARISRARADLDALGMALRQHKRKHGRYPSPDEGLDAVRDLLVDEAIPNDPWGHPYRYRLVDERHFVVVSLGADGREGGDGADRDLGSDDER